MAALAHPDVEAYLAKIVDNAAAFAPRQRTVAHAGRRYRLMHRANVPLVWVFEFGSPTQVERVTVTLSQDGTLRVAGQGTITPAHVLLRATVFWDAFMGRVDERVWKTSAFAKSVVASDAADETEGLLGAFFVEAAAPAFRVVEAVHPNDVDDKE